MVLPYAEIQKYNKYQYVPISQAKNRQAHTLTSPGKKKPADLAARAESNFFRRRLEETSSIYRSAA
jgi:hypothetical protein